MQDITAEQEQLYTGKFLPTGKKDPDELTQIGIGGVVRRSRTRSCQA